MGTEFYSMRDKLNMERLDDVLDGLPSFCGEFFLGIKPQTTALTRLNYAYDLRIFFYFLSTSAHKFKDVDITKLVVEDLNDVTASHIERFLDYLTYYEYNGKKYKCDRRAKARKLSSVRTLFKYFFNKDKIKANTAAKISTPKIPDKEIIRLETDEVVKLLDQVEFAPDMTASQKAFHNITKLRDVAILTLLLGTGIRVSECAGMNVDDVDFETNGFRITRKGGNTVILYFSDEVAKALKRYLDARQSDISVSKKETALFLSLQNKRISVRALQVLVKKYSEIVSPLKKITPHKLRSTYGTSLYRETQDIYVVAEVLGHKDVNTTKKHYAAISDDIRRAAASKVRLRDEK
jgi:site-specific recombinase XerD